MTMPAYIDGLGEIAGLYNGYILDLWGVVHDGTRPFPDTLATLAEMKRARRTVWLLSNAPRRADVVIAALEDMGIGGHLYDGVMTSGEATFHALRDRYLAQWGKRCLHIGGPKNTSLFDGLDITLADRPEKADFILCSGVEDFGDTLDKYIPLLDNCAARGLPMLCANPDRIVHVEDRLVVCAGTMAEHYEQQDGQVVWFGKPYRQVYSHCLARMPAGKVLAVGDGMQTDIAGATGAGIDSVLVTGGIHRDAFTEDGALTPALGNRQEAFFAGYPYRPTHLLPRLYW